MENMSETLSGVLFHQLLGSAVFLAMTFFSLDKSGELNPNVLFAAQDALWCVCVCFLYTYYAENIYKKTSNLADVVYFSSWYAMPTDIQKMTIFLIMQSQKVHRFNCYGIYSVSLANFSLVCVGKKDLQLKLMSFFEGKTHSFFLDYSIIDIILLGDSWTGINKNKIGDETTLSCPIFKKNGEMH